MWKQTQRSPEKEFSISGKGRSEIDENLEKTKSTKHNSMSQLNQSCTSIDLLFRCFFAFFVCCVFLFVFLWCCFLLLDAEAEEQCADSIEEIDCV